MDMNYRGGNVGGRRCAGQRGVKGGKWDNCNSIINKYIKKKLWYIYRMELYSAERKKELIPYATVWMELESIMLSEISQGVRDKYHRISPFWNIINKRKKQTNLTTI